VTCCADSENELVTALDVEYLELEEVLHVCERLGVGPVRDLGLLGGAVERPRTTLFGADAYPDLATKAAALTESIVRNHALFDGNKRLGWSCLVLFVDRNGTWLEVGDDEAYDAIIALASGELSLSELATTIAGWISAR
jgi:death-on-curing protein